MFGVGLIENSREARSVDARTRETYALSVVIGAVAYCVGVVALPESYRRILAEYHWWFVSAIAGASLVGACAVCRSFKDTFLPPKWDGAALMSAVICPWLLAWYAAYITIFSCLLALVQAAYGIHYMLAVADRCWQLAKNCIEDIAWLVRGFLCQRSDPFED